jgi:hypothetical protein
MPREVFQAMTDDEGEAGAYYTRYLHEVAAMEAEQRRAGR